MVLIGVLLHKVFKGFILCILGGKRMEENNSCIFPKCHNCEKGYLLPFSYKEDVFEKWKCSECGFTIQKREDRNM